VHELEQRLGLVEDLMTAGMPTRKIIEELGRQKKWPSSTVGRYIQQVRERWVRERATERATDVEASIARLTMLSHKAERKEAWAAVRGFEQLLADIRGVRAPMDHRHAHAILPQPAAPQQAAIERDRVVESLTDDVLDALERAADEKMGARALPAHADADVNAA
jgi:hypothetical protein